MAELKYEDITRTIIGCGMKVHSYLGLGFPEIIYQRCLTIELDRSGLSFSSEIQKEIMYEGIKVGFRKLDLLVENKVIVELKATGEIEPAHQNQILNYLRVFNLEVGLLLNFGQTSLKFKRFVR